MSMKPWCFICVCVDILSERSSEYLRLSLSWERKWERWMGGWIKRRESIKEIGSFLQLRRPHIFNDNKQDPRSIQDDIFDRKDGQGSTRIWLLYVIWLFSNVTVSAINLGMDGVKNEEWRNRVAHTHSPTFSISSLCSSLLSIWFVHYFHQKQRCIIQYDVVEYSVVEYSIVERTFVESPLPPPRARAVQIIKGRAIEAPITSLRRITNEKTLLKCTLL